MPIYHDHVKGTIFLWYDDKDPGFQDAAGCKHNLVPDGHNDRTENEDDDSNLVCEYCWGRVTP